MRIVLEITSEKEINLPIQYNHIVQGFIYENLADEVFRFFIHDEGFEFNKRKFKLFTFSKILGKFVIDKIGNRIIFQSPIKLVISSPIDKFINEFGKALLEKDKFYLGKNNIQISKIEVVNKGNFSDNVKIRTLSPIVIYSTVEENGKKRTIYHKPGDESFTLLIRRNIEKKYQLLYKKEPPTDDFEIKAANLEKIRLAVINYKNTIIKGYSGDFILKGNPELISLAYDVGLGSKNSQGFGLFDFVVDHQ
ncbi:CRISPR-associated endoribonuclease Cas6 [Anaerobranca gottschalkii]|uniref:CRISPR-associated endoribonuclease n=1 Tax=Anaerobranca gottschalkii DSM 13577 TaxID=1120990 RepID=A0A1I0C2P2_9FIRM|nr:CRISPR-associated endoribonuclease Cas6 [Anaerobranca gottschalkii]SET13032.1 CRISPR-associated endoribonuclease Cas6 [Anaerobranca gottschalkii DSM 13577]